MNFELIKEADLLETIRQHIPKAVVDYGKSGLAGAGLGALGSGAATYLGSRATGEDAEHSKQKAYQAALAGGLLGGSAGLGYQAFKDNFTAPGGNSKIIEDAAAKGQRLDTRSFSEAHPIHQQINNLGKADAKTVGTAGAGAGLWSYFKKGRGLSKLIEEKTTGFKDDEIIKRLQQAEDLRVKEINAKALEAFKEQNRDVLAKMSPDEVRKHIAENVSKATPNVIRLPPDELQFQKAMQAAKQISKGNVADRSRALEELVMRNPAMDTTQMDQVAGALGVREDKARKLINQLYRTREFDQGNYIPTEATGLRGKNLPFTGKSINDIQNAIGRLAVKLPISDLGTKMRGASRVGKYGIGGAAAAVGAQKGIKGLNDLIIRLNNSPEQIEYWNTYGQ